MDELTNVLIKEYGEDLASEIISGFKSKPLTIRVNTLKCDKDYIKDVLDNFNIGYRDVNFYKDALILDCNENRIREFDIYKNGMIYLQSLSSMIPPLCLDIKTNESILDMAAAPGGKTCEIASLSDNKARITATEPNKIRFERLKYNVTKQGARVSVLREDARGLDEFLRFDKILLDAPCSGSGTITNNKFNFDLVNRSVKRQKELLVKASQILKSGGFLLYSTCSILKEENEENIKYLLDMGNMEIVDINNDLFKDIPTLPSTIDGVITVKPNNLYEGFFIALLRKK